MARPLTLLEELAFLAGLPLGVHPDPQQVLAAVAVVSDPPLALELHALLARWEEGRGAIAPAAVGSFIDLLERLPATERGALVDRIVGTEAFHRLALMLDHDDLLSVFLGLDRRAFVQLVGLLLADASAATVVRLQDAVPGLEPGLDAALLAPGTTWVATSGPVLEAGGADPDEVHQGRVGDCFFAAALIAVARLDPGFLARHVRDNGNGTTTVTLHEAGVDVPLTVTNRVPAVGGVLEGIDSPAGAWPELWEKAYAQLRGSYARIERDTGAHGLELVTGRGTVQVLADLVTPELVAEVLRDRPVLVGTRQITPLTTEEVGDDVRSRHLVHHHQYVLTGLGPRTHVVTLRNPWDPRDSPRISWATFQHDAFVVTWTERPL